MKKIIHSPAPWFPIEFGGIYMLNDSDQYESKILLHCDEVGEDIAESNAIIASKAPDMYKCLWNLNTYFIDLQNKGILTVSEEGQWKQISKILSDIETYKEYPK